MQARSAGPGPIGTPRCCVRHGASRSEPAPASDPTCFHILLVTGRAAGAPGHLCLRGPGDASHDDDPESAPWWAVAFHADALGSARSDGEVFCLPAGDLLLAAFAARGGGVERRFPIAPADWPAWVTRLTSLERELATRDIGSGAAARALLELLLIDVARLAHPGVHEPGMHARPILAWVFRFIEQRFRTPIGLADVAKAVARSPSYLTDLVRRETGRTVLQWIIERRMAEARRLLAESELLVKDIAPHVGYDDAGYFIRQFHRVHGDTPQHWRMASRHAGLAYDKGAPGPWKAGSAHATESLSIAGGATRGDGSGGGASSPARGRAMQRGA